MMSNGAEFFPMLNASLNSFAAILLVLGLILVKQGRFEMHKKIMLSAFGVSALFLVSYLYYHANFPERKFGGEGPIRIVYFTILISHIILAVGVLPFILKLLQVAFKGEIQKHKKLARIVYPIWMYNSITGVLVYFFLYHWYPTAPVAETVGALVK